jgi:predicted small lipoprotein YifL
VRILFVTAAVIALSACGSEQPAPAPSAAPSAAVDTEPTLPPPGKDMFAAAFKEACPKAKPVSAADCVSQGFGKSGFACRFGLGDDPYERYNANLEPGEGKWDQSHPPTPSPPPDQPADAAQ